MEAIDSISLYYLLGRYARRTVSRLVSLSIRRGVVVFNVTLDLEGGAASGYINCPGKPFLCNPTHFVASYQPHGPKLMVNFG